MGPDFQFHKRRVLEMGGDDGGTTMWMDLMLLPRVLKSGQDGSFYVMCVSPHKN